MRDARGTTRRAFLGSAAAATLARPGEAQESPRFQGNVVLGRPTNRSITVSVLSPESGDVSCLYGVQPGIYSNSTAAIPIQAGLPLEIDLDSLASNTRYYYRLNFRREGESFATGSDSTFHTQRDPGSSFAFCIQGDSHPERLGRMYDPDLYLRTMLNVANDHPDFYLTLGDDFSIDRLYNRDALNSATVGELYAAQRELLGVVGRCAPLFLVNGNHEHAARYLLDGTPTSPPVLAARSRNLYYPLPTPDGFYTGDTEPVEYVGPLRDYYAFTWGDALFVTLDPYWHSPVQVDDDIGGGQKDGGGRKGRDWWAITMGDAQYRWFKETLEQSNARYRFVFAHHVLGTGRGGIEMADQYEWGGLSASGAWEFNQFRPGWELPIHQLMARHGVDIFFQGHDHLFARQQKDGVVYQEVPNPADGTYTAFNKDAYLSGDIEANSGHLRVMVSPEKVTVDYVRAYLPRDEGPDRKNGGVASSYEITEKRK